MRFVRIKTPHNLMKDWLNCSLNSFRNTESKLDVMCVIFPAWESSLAFQPACFCEIISWISSKCNFFEALKERGTLRYFILEEANLNPKISLRSLLILGRVLLLN